MNAIVQPGVGSRWRPSARCDCVRLACAASRSASAERSEFWSFCASSRATTCPGLTWSPPPTRRSINFPSARNARFTSSRGLIVPVMVIGSETTRRSTVTVRTGRSVGGAAEFVSLQAASASAAKAAIA